MYCMHCGSQIPDGAGFCPSCGQRTGVTEVRAGATDAGAGQPGQAYVGQTYAGQPLSAQPYTGQPYAGQGFGAQAYANQPGQANPGQPYADQAYAGQPYASQPGAQQPYAPQATPQAQRKFNAAEAAQAAAGAASSAAAGARTFVTNVANKAASTVNQMAGGSDTDVVELRFGDFFDAVPTRHAAGDSEEVFICGTASTTPPIDKITVDWPHPWVYSRVLAMLAVTFIGCVALFSVFGNPLAIPGLIFVGAFMAPFSALIFFFEVNAPRNIFIAETVTMFFTGGVGSILVLYPVSALIPGGGTVDIVPAMITGLTEEIAKIVIIVVFMRRSKDRNYILNGLLIGAAVGAGFAAFESAGYAYVAGISEGYESMLMSIVGRGILSIGGHVAWAAVEGAALALVEGDQGFSLQQLQNTRFVSLALIPVVLHGIWDAYIPVLDDIDILIFPVKYVLLIVAVWIVLVVMLHRGLAQVNVLAAQASVAATAGEGDVAGAGSAVPVSAQPAGSAQSDAVTWSVEGTMPFSATQPVEVAMPVAAQSTSSAQPAATGWQEARPVPSTGASGGTSAPFGETFPPSGN